MCIAPVNCRRQRIDSLFLQPNRVDLPLSAYTVSRAAAGKTYVCSGRRNVSFRDHLRHSVLAGYRFYFPLVAHLQICQDI